MIPAGQHLLPLDDPEKRLLKQLEDQQRVRRITMVMPAEEAPIEQDHVLIAWKKTTPPAEKMGACYAVVSAHRGKETSTSVRWVLRVQRIAAEQAIKAFQDDVRVINFSWLGRGRPTRS